MFALVVGARMKARMQDALSIGWYSGKFMGSKLKALAHYLEDGPARDQKAANVMGVFQRVKAKQEAANGNR